MRLLSQSAMRFDAVRLRLLGVSLFSAGQGMESRLESRCGVPSLNELVSHVWSVKPVHKDPEWRGSVVGKRDEAPPTQCLFGGLYHLDWDLSACRRRRCRCWNGRAFVHGVVVLASPTGPSHRGSRLWRGSWFW